MICTTLFGGLGNQMFIYAAVRAAALRNKTQMAFNLKQGFKDDVMFHRKLELHHFELELPKAGIKTFDIPLGKYFRFISRKAGRNILCPKMRYIQNELVPRGWVCNHNNAYLEGYWAGTNHFEDYSEIIRKDFTIKQQYITEDVKKELSEINRKGCTPVFVGVRRYQECATSSDIPNGGLGEDVNYYKKAMKYISEHVDKPLFWVFSQVQEWFRENVDDGSYNVVYARPKKGVDSAIEDMYLMTQCEHAIISYSTYYWWAAWLIKNTEKIVICPSTYDGKQSLCDGWIIMK